MTYVALQLKVISVTFADLPTVDYCYFVEKVTTFTVAYFNFHNERTEQQPFSMKY